MSTKKRTASDASPQGAAARTAGSIGNWIVRLVVASVALLTLLTPPIQAQEAAKSGAESPPMAESKTSSTERLIYVPYRSLKEVFNQQGSTVFLPYAEYLKQWAQPKPGRDKVVDVVLTEAHYVGRVDQSLLRVTVTLKAKVLGKAWSEVPVKFGAAAVGKLTSKSGDVLLRGTGDGTYALMFGTVGDHEIEVELAAPIETSPDGRRAAFDVPPVAVTTFELAIPDADQTINLGGKVVSLPVATQGKETRIKANLGATTSVSANWHPRTSAKPEMDLLTAVTNLQRVVFRDGLVHTDAWLTYDVLRGEMTEVTLLVPPGQRVLGVTSNEARVRAWKAEPGNKQQTVKVEFLNPATGKVTLEVHTEREFGTEAVAVLGKTDDGSVLGIQAKEAVRESGQITVVNSPDLTLAFEQVQGLARIDQAETEARIKVPGASTFKFYGSNAKLAVLAKPVEARLAVNGGTHVFEIHEDEIRLDATFPVQVDRAGIFELRFTLPDLLQIDDVVCQNQNASVTGREFQIEGDSPRVLRIPLSKKTAPNDHLSVKLRGRLKFAEANEMVELTMPLPEPQGVEQETGTVTVMAAESVEVITDPTSVVGAQPIPIGAGASQGVSHLRVASMYSFNRRPVTIPVKTVRKPTRLTATIATTVNIKEESTEVESLLTYLVEYAGLDTFRFSLPEDVAPDVQIVSLESAPLPPIKQKVKAEKAEDGWLTWTITLQREVTGPYRFKLTYDIQPKDADEKDGEKPKTSLVQVARLLGLDGSDAKKRDVALASVHGEVVVEKSRALAINATKLDETLEAIDVRELTLLPQSGAQAFRYFKQPAAVQVVSRKFDIQEVVETVVMRGLVETVTRHDANAAYRCRYWIKSSERQRLRLDLPVGSEVLGVFVDGKSISPERNTEKRDEFEVTRWDSYYINVARTKSSDEPFGVLLQMQVPVGGRRVPFDSQAGHLELPLPQIGGVKAIGVAVQQLRTEVWVPPRYDLVGEPEHFVNESKLSLGDVLLLQRYMPRDNFDGNHWVNVSEAGIIDFPTDGTRYSYSNLGGAKLLTVTWASRSYYRWLLSGALIVIALLLRKMHWERKLLLLLLVATAAGLFGLSYPGWVVELIGVSRVGWGALAGIWILTTLFSLKLVSNDTAPNPLTESRVRIATGTSVPVPVPPPGVFDDVRNAWDGK